jgi:transcriptional regulator with PAS, ATPase and Fis domain
MIQTLNQKHGTRVSNLDPEVLHLFDAYHWPGNARELRNVIERAVIVASVGAVHVNHLPSPFFFAKSAMDETSTPTNGGGILLQPGHRMSESDEAFIKLTLEHAGNNRKVAAKMLGISLRTLQTRLNEFKKAKAAGGL